MLCGDNLLLDLFFHRIVFAGGVDVFVDTFKGCEWKCHVVIGHLLLLELLFIECFCF